MRYSDQVTIVEEITPVELGIDQARFPGWRPGQYQIFMDTMDCQTRFSGHCAPCGFGKSLCMICYALTTGSRTLILTPFKGLQDQLSAEFPGMVTDLKGKANYFCVTMQTNCEMGSPRCDVRNSIMGALCDHKSAVSRATNAQIVVTNYSCWFHQIYGQGIGDFDTIIMDEADAAESALSEFLSFSLSSKEALGDSGKSRAPHWNDPLRAWIDWAKDAIRPMKALVAQAEKDAKESDDRRVLERFFHLRNLYKKLITLAEMKIEEWVSEPAKDGIRFDPIWPGNFAEKYLFRGVKRVILFSGTLNRKAFDLLGVRQDQYTFYDYDSPFHPARNPLILAPIGNFKYPIKPELMSRTIDFFDDLVDARKDRKGILHTVSFAHLEDFIQRSRHVNLFISNDVKYAGGMRRTENVVESFKQATVPAVLASPSITSGWDFPGCLAPNTRVLTKSLEWVDVADLQVGDELVGFDEDRPEAYRSRQFQTSTVTIHGRAKKPCFKITLEDNTEFVCSTDHLWLAKLSNGNVNWAQANYLRVPRASYHDRSSLCRVFDVWGANGGWDAGYVAAAFDGEGHLTSSINKWNRGSNQNVNWLLGYTQCENEMLDRMREILAKEKFNHHEYREKRPADKERWREKVRLMIMGREDMVRLLGWARPPRIMNKFDIDKLGSVRTTGVGIASREFIGEQEIVVMETSTKTFIAEGFASHNSACRYQFILKVPFPDTQSTVAKARKKLDPEYHDNLAMTSLIQMCSRACRSQYDFNENIIPDMRVGWFLANKKHLAAKWFLGARGSGRYRRLNEGAVPEPIRG